MNDAKQTNEIRNSRYQLFIFASGSERYAIQEFVETDLRRIWRRSKKKYFVRDFRSKVPAFKVHPKFGGSWFVAIADHDSLGQGSRTVCDPNFKVDSLSAEGEVLTTHAVDSFLTYDETRTDPIDPLGQKVGMNEFRQWHRDFEFLHHEVNCLVELCRDFSRRIDFLIWNNRTECAAIEVDEARDAIACAAFDASPIGSANRKTPIAAELDLLPIFLHGAVGDLGSGAKALLPGEKIGHVAEEGYGLGRVRNLLWSDGGGCGWKMQGFGELQATNGRDGHRRDYNLSSSLKCRKESPRVGDWV